MNAKEILRVIVRVVTVATVFAVATAGPAAGQFGGTDVPVDPDLTSSVIQNEVSLTLIPGTQPGQPALLVAAYNDNPWPGGNGLGVSLSTDGGANWSSLQLPFPAGMADAFDPTAAADTQGNAFIAHISKDGTGWTATSGPGSGLYVHRYNSLSGAWSGPVAVSTDPPGSGTGFRFNDRDQITVDTFSGSPYTNNVYVAWIKDRGVGTGQLFSDIYFAYSTNTGASFNLATGTSAAFPGRINDEKVGHDMSNMPVPAVASDGTIYVSWLDYNVRTGGIGIIYLDKSSDGGVTWGTDIAVTPAAINLPPLRLNSGSDVLAKGAPVIAVSPTNPNEVYIVYAADPTEPAGAPNDEADIFFIKSTNGGTTWSSPLQVNSDSTISDQFLPWMEVKPNGTIDVVWYDRRNDPMDLNWDVYMATSTDGGNSFSTNIQLNDTSFASPANRWLGEYLGLVVDSSYGYVAWTSSVKDTVNGDIYFDKTPNNVGGYWRFDENTGDTAGDCSVNGNHGRLGSTSGSDASDPTWTTGIKASALSFDGVNDYVEVAGSPSLDITSRITIEGWVYVQGGLLSSAFPVVCKANAYWLHLFNDRIRFGTSRGVLDYMTPVPLSTWTYLAATYDGSNLRMYVNGTLRATQAATGNILINNNPLFIGAYSTFYLNGKIDEVAIWSRALTSTEIQNRYTRLGPARNISTGSFFPSITAAVNLAGAGNTIAVAAGINFANITISRPITLVGAGSNLSTINGCIPNVISINDTSDVQIQGFTIQHSCSAGIGVNNSTGVTITDNVITNANVGVELNSSADCVVSGNTIVNNASSNISVIDEPAGAANTITDNAIAGSYAGIYIESGSPIIEDNLIEGNQIGIYVVSGSPVIGNNVFLDNVLDMYPMAGSVPIDEAYLTPKKVNLTRKAKHSFKVHIYPCEPMDVYVGALAEVYVDVDGSGIFGVDEGYPAIVSSTDVDGEAPDITIKVYVGEDLVDNDAGVAIYSINDIDIVYADELGGGLIDDLVLDTFQKERHKHGHKDKPKHNK